MIRRSRPDALLPTSATAPSSRRRGRRAAAGLGVAALAVGAVSFADAAQPGAPTARLADVRVASQFAPAVTGVTLESTPAGPDAALGGRAASVSDDGRLVTFVGPRDPASSDDASPGSGSSGAPLTTAYLRDRATSTLVDLLPPAAGRRDGDTAFARVSDDGCSITVTTQTPLDLFDDDDEGERWDVYRASIPRCRPHDVTAAPVDDATDLDWELVSADDDGRARNDVDPTFAPSVSAVGSVVAYVVPTARRSALRQVLVTDLTVPVGDVGRTTPVPGLPADAPTDGAEHVGQVQPAVSGDGDVIAFASDADAAAAEPSWSEPSGERRRTHTQVFAWNRATDAVTPVSTAAASPTPSPRGADQPSVSADGSVIAFVGVPRASTTDQVYVWRADGDRNGTADDRTLELVSRRDLASADSPAGNGRSWHPTLSADGTTLVFSTRAADLVTPPATPGRRGDDGDVVVVDLVQRSVRRVALLPDAATPAPAAHASPALAANGRVVVFDTAAAAEMVPGAPRTPTRQVVASSLPVSLSLPALDAGTTPPDWPSPEWYLTVSNAGPSTFRPRVVRSSDPQFAVTGGDCIGAAVPSGGSCTVRVVFTPTAPGDAVAELTVAERGFRAAEVSTALTGSGGEPMLSATPAGAAFADTVVGQQSPPIGFEVRNVGSVPAALLGVSIGGVHRDDVRLASSDCADRTLAPGAVCTVEVVFAPTAAGVRAALVTISTTSGSRTSALVSGVATSHPEFVTLEEVRAGRPLDVLGWGYPPGTVVVVSWADGLGRTVTAETDERGEFTARVPIHHRERPGHRELVVSDPSGGLPRISRPVLVRPGR